MIFKDYRDIAQSALRIYEDDALMASSAIGIDQTTFHRVLSGDEPDMRTTHMLLVFLSRLSIRRRVSQD